MRTLLGVSACLGLALVSQTASAGEVTRVASSFEENDKFDLYLGVSYEFDNKRASVLREFSSDRGNRLVRDLVYKQSRHMVTPLLEIGLYHDLSIYTAIPIVVADQRRYELDKSDGDDCIFPQDVQATNEIPTCVNKSNSTSIRDGIIPAAGWDSLQREAAYEQFRDDATDIIFRSPQRKGLDQIHAGIKYGLMNQSKLSHLPNWVIGLEGRFSIGNPMQLTRDIDLTDPSSNHSVGRGQHELGAWTALSRRHTFLEPFFTGYWRMGVRATKTELQSFAGAQTERDPPQYMGTRFGTEIVPWENEEKQQKVSLILSGNLDFQTRGRAYSEAWEILADSPALAGTFAPGENPCNSRAALNYANDNLFNPDGYLEAANNASNSGGCQTFNGVTTVDNYATLGLTAAANFWFGKYARLNLGADLQTVTRHFVTNASRGDATADSGGDPQVVDPDTIEVNPVRRDIIDNVGRRYAVDNMFNIVGFANFLLTF
jgi:hypothetical protein